MNEPKIEILYGEKWVGGPCPIHVLAGALLHKRRARVNGLPVLAWGYALAVTTVSTAAGEYTWHFNKLVQYSPYCVPLGSPSAEAR